MAGRTISSNSDEGPRAVSPGVALLREEITAGRLRALSKTTWAGYALELSRGRDALWLLIRREGRGGIAYRAAYFAAGIASARMVRRKAGESLRAEVRSPLGRHRVAVSLHDGPIPLLRCVSTIEPHAPLLASFVPRDIYPINEKGKPEEAVGQVEAAQRGMNTAAIYFRLTDPDFGSVLYLQDLTSLNRFFSLTGTKPDGAMGGLWPEIGYLMPTPPQQGQPACNPLRAAEETVLSDGWVAIHADSGGDEQDMARRYLSLLGEMAAVVAKPEPQFHDWEGRARATLSDLETSPKATVDHYGFTYLHPYTDAEYPDSMVQLTVLAAIRDFERWSGATAPFGDELAAGLAKFYDAKRKTLRRYLPNVGSDKDRFATDSWYLYHPLLQLGRLAAAGDKRAHRLFEKSIGFGVKAARHFSYKWPIQYDLRNFEVITEARDDQGYGQTDVGGLYAAVMLQAFELTDDKTYLDEARAAIDAGMGLRFELNYQANVTAWGAAACMRLWRITGEETYRRQAYVFLASFFQNTAMWESNIDNARHYRTFLGVTALHDAPYMALYECFDSFQAFEKLLLDSGLDLDPGARLLVTQYCRHALDRAWYYYPDALPKDAIAPKQRENNGHIDRTLSFPVEDLYVDGQPAGQVGQEIYGCGAALVFASRAFHRIAGARFRIFCDHFVVSCARPRERALKIELAGAPGGEALLAFLGDGAAQLPSFKVTAGSDQPIDPVAREGKRAEYRIRSDLPITVEW